MLRVLVVPLTVLLLAGRCSAEDPCVNGRTLLGSPCTTAPPPPAPCTTLPPQTDEPCDIVTCKSFKGQCMKGQKPASPDKECQSGLCSEAQCCEAKPCDKTQTDKLCVGSWTAKVFNSVADFKFSEKDAISCGIGSDRLSSEAACKAAATKLKMSFIMSIDSERYPHGCFECTSASQCSALVHGAVGDLKGGLFWNSKAQAKKTSVAKVRHQGTKILCQTAPPGCLASGCDAETCCTPLTCGTNFNGQTCFAGEKPKEASTMCNKKSKTKADKCTRDDCCQPLTCATTNMISPLCTDGWTQNDAASKTPCPQTGCTKQLCCKQDTCATAFAGEIAAEAPPALDHSVTSFVTVTTTTTYDFSAPQPCTTAPPTPQTCGAGEDLQAQVPCPISGCTKETCCKRKTCATYNCQKACSSDWMAKKGNIFCPATGCDEFTCCEIKTCNFDWKGKCGKGQLAADPHTICPDGKCDKDVCCIGKLCSTDFSCSAAGLALGLKPKPVGTMCDKKGCTADTCCSTATCGTDFPQGGCGAWSNPKPGTTLCPSGKCDDETCCTKLPCLIEQATCNTAKIKDVTSFDGYNTQFPTANSDFTDAEGACNALERSDCFATLDENCDGKSLKRCVPDHKNDPKSMVLRPSTTSCVCYRKEEPTCGHNMPDGTFCGDGEKVNFYKECGGSSGKLCDKKTCCEPLTCETSFFLCALGEKQKSGSITCPKDGCDSKTCCEQLTCGTDFKETCAAGTNAVPAKTKCSAGTCTAATCCQAVDQTTTTSPPVQAVCSTDYRGSCSVKEEFLPNNICQGSSFVLADKDTNECSGGYSRITTLSDCVAGALAMKDDLKINGEDGKPVSTDEATLTSEIQKRIIAVGSGLGAHKPYGCYYDSQNQAVKGVQMKINNVWLNKEQAIAGAHDNSALICKSNSACSHSTCCKEVGDTTTCDTFNGCKDALGFVALTGNIMCAKTGCDAAQCCRAKTCGDYFASTAGSGACGTHQNRLSHDIECSGGPCSQKMCCKDQATTTTSINPCTTVYHQQTAPPMPQIQTPSPTPAPTLPTTTLPTCGGKFALGTLDSTSCPAGFVQIDTLEKCVEGAMFLKIQPSDTNGDGIQTDPKDKAAMTSFVQQREIQASDQLGIHKPHGCFQDVSLRLVNGEQNRITSIWLNHRVDQAGAHDNSSPICQEDCTSVAALRKYDTESSAETRQAVAGHPEGNNIPTVAVGALCAVGLLTLVTFVHRHIGSRREVTDVVHDDDTELMLGTDHDPLE